MVDDLQLLLDRIAAGAPTETDLATLRRALSVGGEQDVIQVGKYNVRIDEGREVPPSGRPLVDLLDSSSPRHAPPQPEPPPPAEP